MQQVLGVRPIQDCFLRKNYVFAMEWQQGFLFGRVVRRRICQWKPWPVIDTDGTAIDIASNAAQGSLRFNDPRNVRNDLLYLSSTVSGGWPWFYHGSFGIKPGAVNMYLQFPETVTIDGKFPNIDPLNPATGPDAGFINSLNSPYECPTDFREFVIPPRLRIGAQYFNKEGSVTGETRRSHQPVVNILFCLYHFQVLKPPVHSDLIRSIATRRQEAGWFTVGQGAELPLEMGSDLIEDWLGKQPELLMTLDEASELGVS